MKFVPTKGRWNHRGFPDTITHNGRAFRKARLKDTYRGVVEQYREAIAQNSMHMKVMSDGTWVIDHVDRDNPDMGRPVEHFFNDHPVGQFIKGAATIAAVLGLVAGVGSLLTKR